MRRVSILGAVLVAAPVAAQEATTETAAPAPATEVKGRIVTSGVFYGESSSSVDSSDQDLAFLDLRARLDITHIKGTAWEVLGDFRLRLAPSDDAARGYLGGDENDLTELYAAYRGTKLDFIAGRQVIRDVDATGIDGASLQLHLSKSAELGFFGGLYPNPFSRTFYTDYPDVPASEVPVAGGTWLGYRGKRLYGTVGLGVISAQYTQDGIPPDPLRVFLSAAGYAQLSSKIVLFHYLAFDLEGPMGATFTNANVGATWHVTDTLRLEANYSHMSTHALAFYVRKYFEAIDPSNLTRIQNNLFVQRTASDEGRLGADLSLPDSKIDIYGSFRFRRRDVLADPLMPVELANLPADNQIEASGGVRQHDAFAGLTIGGSAAWIHGARTDSETASITASRTFAHEKVEMDLDATYLHFQDFCSFNLMLPTDPTCTGSSKGDDIEIGGTVVWTVSRTWLVLMDYHLGFVKSLADSVSETILSNTVFLRAQRSF